MTLDHDNAARADTASAAVLGWREWLALPALGIAHIKAKLDTGARSSALHAYRLETYLEGGAAQVRFWLHPMQKDTELSIVRTAPMVDRRWVSDSGGHRERRPIIVTTVAVGEARFEAELTLTNRDSMRFRMLLGRTALAGRYLVDSNASYRLGRPSRQARSAPLYSMQPDP